MELEYNEIRALNMSIQRVLARLKTSRPHYKQEVQMFPSYQLAKYPATGIPTKSPSKQRKKTSHSESLYRHKHIAQSTKDTLKLDNSFQKKHHPTTSHQNNPKESMHYQRYQSPSHYYYQTLRTLNKPHHHDRQHDKQHDKQHDRQLKYFDASSIYSQQKRKKIAVPHHPHPRQVDHEEKCLYFDKKQRNEIWKNEILHSSNNNFYTKKTNQFPVPVHPGFRTQRNFYNNEYSRACSQSPHYTYHKHRPL